MNRFNKTCTDPGSVQVKKIPRKYQPKGFEILYEDDEIIVGNKAFGYLTVGAMYERERTVQHALNEYARKGNFRSHKRVYVVHRLDRETSGLLIFAKSEKAQVTLKDHWKDTVKTYYAVVHGRLNQKSGTITSYLVENEDYTMHSAKDSKEGKLARTAYTVVRETVRFSLLKINLLTGRKNQIRVHLAGEGHPVVGDAKYGRHDTRYQRLALHAQSISFPHPSTGERMTFEAGLPEYFHTLAA